MTAPFDYRGRPKWEGAAYYAGAEAQANGRAHLHADDRLDIALAYGVTGWLDLPADVRAAARALFQAGVRAERTAGVRAERTATTGGER